MHVPLSLDFSFPQQPREKRRERSGLRYRKCTWRPMNFRFCLKTPEKSTHDCRGKLENSSYRTKEVDPWEVLVGPLGMD